MESKLPTCHICIISRPRVITDSAPGIVVTDFNSSFKVGGSIPKPDVSLRAAYRLKWSTTMQKPSVHCSSYSCNVASLKVKPATLLAVLCTCTRSRVTTRMPIARNCITCSSTPVCQISRFSTHKESQSDESVEFMIRTIAIRTH